MACEPWFNSSRETTDGADQEFPAADRSLKKRLHGRKFFAGRCGRRPMPARRSFIPRVPAGKRPLGSAVIESPVFWKPARSRPPPLFGCHRSLQRSRKTRRARATNLRRKRSLRPARLVLSACLPTERPLGCTATEKPTGGGGRVSPPGRPRSSTGLASPIRVPFQEERMTPRKMTRHFPGPVARAHLRAWRSTRITTASQ